MRVSCSRPDLLSAFQMVSAIVPSRSPKPILHDVKFVAEPDSSYLSATDLEVGIRRRVAGVEVEQSGTVVLPASQLMAILRESADSVLRIEAKEAAGEATATTQIWGQRSQFELPSEPPEEYPEVPDFDQDSYYEVSSDLLRTMIRRSIFATDVESMRYALNGLLVELEGNNISVVATDGRRLALMRGSAKLVGKAPAEPPRPIVPAKAMSLLERNLHGDDKSVHLSFLPNKMLARTEEAVISSRLVEGNFPRYQEVFPQRHEATLVLNVREFFQSVRQAAIATSDESRGVDFQIADGRMKLAARAADVGQSNVELPVAYDGKPITITFDPRYLVDMLRTLDEDSTVTLELIDAESAAVFRTEDGYCYVVMPLTRER